MGLISTTTTCKTDVPETLSWECLVKSDATFLLGLGILMVLSPIGTLMAGRSRNITLDKQENTLTLNWSGILDSKLGEKTRVWALSDVIGVEIKRAKRKRWEFFKLCLVLKSGRRLPVTEYTLGRRQVIRDANRISYFLELDDTVWTPGWYPEDENI